jgi:riboflavin kinase/FMN adenylyltransferase
VSGSFAHSDQPVALTIGVFDGVHRGHQYLIGQMVESARTDGVASVCITFDPDPEVIVHPERPHFALSTLPERTSHLLSLGVAHVEIVPFSREIAVQSPEEFVEALCARYPLRSLWVGVDFALGRDRAGSVERLGVIGAERGFSVHAVELLKHDDRPISATWIRTALASGDVGLSADLLGRPYCIEGRVAPGAQRGRTIGFPTANIVPPPGRALPADGVYLVRVSGPALEPSTGGGGSSERFGVVNLGGRPTFGETERLLETHVLDFEGELYGSELEVCSLEQLRGIQKFANIDELRNQIARDVARARELISSRWRPASSTR